MRSIIIMIMRGSIASAIRISSPANDRPTFKAGADKSNAILTRGGAQPSMVPTGGLLTDMLRRMYPGTCGSREVGSRSVGYNLGRFVTNTCCSHILTHDG